jgi:protein-disulfide isomerase
MKHSAMDFATLGIFACAVVLTGVVVRREFFRSNSPAMPAERTVFPRKELTMVGRVIGPDTAPVTIVEFSDFQCPYCAKAVAVMDSLRGKYPDKAKVLYRHLPLETLHPFAWTAALASECAADQGKFSEYHDLLFRVQDSLGHVTWPSLAKRAGLSNVKAFEQCLTEERHSLSIKRDVLLARDLDLRGTPAFIVGRDLFEGTPPFAWFERRVSEALRGKAVD